MEQLESDDYFEILGLARTATESDVRRTYRRLAVQWHPDKNRTHPKAEEYFKKIGEAYAVLSDPEQRAHYERYGKAGRGSGEWGATDSPRSAGDPFGASFDPFDAHAGFSMRHARDLFEAFFRGMDMDDGDPFLDAVFGGNRSSNSSSRHQRRASRQHAREWDPFADMGFGGFGFGFGSGFGFGGMGMMDMDAGMRSGGGGGGLATRMVMTMDPFADLAAFASSSSSSSGGGFGVGSGNGGFATSVSSSSYTDRNGHVVTTKTTTTVDASGRRESVTEEFRNGRLVSSTSASRLADAGRMQLESGGGGGSSRRVGGSGRARVRGSAGESSRPDSSHRVRL